MLFQGGRGRGRRGGSGTRGMERARAPFRLHVLLIVGSILVAGVLGGLSLVPCRRGPKVLSVKCVISMGRLRHWGNGIRQGARDKTSRLAKRLCPFFCVCFFVASCLGCSSVGLVMSESTSLYAYWCRFLDSERTRWWRTRSA